MSRISHLRQTADALQRRLTIRIITTLVIVATAGWFFGTALYVRAAFDGRARTIDIAVTGEDASQYARLLRETGEVEIDGEVYSAPAAPLELLISPEDEISDPVRLVFLLLRDHVPTWMPSWLLVEQTTAWTLLIATITVGVLAVWLGLLVPIVMTGVVGGVLAGLAWLIGAELWILPLLAMAGLFMVFLILTNLASWLLARPIGWCAVAHTLLKEAARTRLSLGFVILLLVVLPLLPLTINLDGPLRHAIQAYLGRSIGFTFLLAAIMTVTLACSTVAFDVRDRYIWHLVTKPLDRLSYLVGKFAGVAVLNAVVLIIAGGWVYGYVQYMRHLPVPPTLAGAADQLAIEEEVLVARDIVRPVYGDMDEKDVRATVDQILENDPAYAKFVDTDVPLSVRRRLRKKVMEDYEWTLRRVASPADPTAEPWTTVQFDGLGAARDAGGIVRLRFRLYGGIADEHDRRLVGFTVGNESTPGVVGAFIPTVKQYLDIPTDAINSNGTLQVTIANLTQHAVPPGSGWRGPADLVTASQSPGPQKPFSLLWLEEDFEIVYPSGGFDSNLARALIVLWVKLTVLALIGCALATFLSFPVACLAAFTLLAGASIAPWLTRAMGMTIPMPVSAVDWANIGQVLQWGMESFVRTIAESMVYVLGAYGEFQPTDDLVQGRRVSWNIVGASMVQLGLVWGGISMVLGWLIFRQRQVAIYSGGQ